MASSDRSEESPDWLDVLGIDALSGAEQSGRPAESLAAAETVVGSASHDPIGSVADSETNKPENDDSGSEEAPDEISSADDDGQDDELVAGKSEAQRAKEEAKEKKEAEEAARFEERKQRRLQADEQDDDSGPLIPKGKFVAVVIGLGLLYLAVNFLDVFVTSRSGFEGEASAAVVLGAAQYNGEPSGALQGRLDRAAELYGDGLVEKIVVTGGGQETDITTEAKTGYDYLRSNAGIPDEDLLLEVQGATTYEQLAAVSRILEQEKTTDVVVVTDPYHARRSMLIAGEVGLEAQAAITDNRSDSTRLFSESVAISVGRLISFRRFDAYFN